MIELLQHTPLLLIGMATLLGFYMGIGAKKIRLPSLIGFMALGVMLGPSLFNVFSEEPDLPSSLEHFSFITEIALGFVAFTIGAELSLDSLRRLGKGIISIIFAESFTAFFVVTGVIFLLTKNWPVSLLFGALAPASAPAGTVAVIQEYKAKGSLTKALYAVVGFDDGLAIIIFGFAAALARALLLNSLGVHEEGSDSILHMVAAPMFEIGASLLIGTSLGFLFCQIVRRLQHGRDMLIIAFGTVLLACGIAAHFHLSLILTNMVIGFVLVNTRKPATVHKVMAPLQEIMPLLFLLFFCLAGAHLKVSELPKLGLIGVVYILGRSAGLILGARLGSAIGHVEEKIKKYIGLGILSQAGVAIGLSLIIRQDYARLAAQPNVAAAITRYAAEHPQMPAMLYDPIAIATALITTITATCIVFEVVGPILTKIALIKAGEINVSGEKTA